MYVLRAACEEKIRRSSVGTIYWDTLGMRTDRFIHMIPSRRHYSLFIIYCMQRGHGRFDKRSPKMLSSE